MQYYNYSVKTKFMYRTNKAKPSSIKKDSFEKIHRLPALAVQEAAPCKTKAKTSLIGPISYLFTHFFDASTEKVLIELDIGKERVKGTFAGQNLLRVGVDALQEISLFASHHLRD